MIASFRLSATSVVARAAFVLAVIATAFAFAQAAQAETINQGRASATNLGLYGGEVRDIEVDTNSDYIYVTTYSPNGVYVSANNGASWTGLPAGTDYGEPRGVEIDSAGNVYVVLSEGVFKSTNRGTSWSELSGIDGQYGANIDIAPDDTIYIGRTDGGVSVSRDGGATFTTTSLRTDGMITDSVSGAQTAGTAYAVASTGNTVAAGYMYKTTDFGANWTLLNTSSITTTFNQAIAHPALANGIIVLPTQADAGPWASADGGATWRELDVSVYASKLGYDTNGRMYLGVNYSDDGGETWSAVNASTPGSRESGIVIPDPDDPNVLYGATFGAFAISRDRGATWTDSNAGITAVTVNDIAQSKDKRVVWVATNAGLARSTNFTSDNPTWSFPIYYDIYGQSVWVDQNDKNHVVVGGYQNIVVTRNGGDSWTTATGWDSTLAVQQIVAEKGSSNVLYAAGAYQNYATNKTGGVYKSVDGGNTWTNLSFPNNYAAQSLAVASNGTLYVGTGLLGLNAASETGIYKYTDGTWSKLSGSPAEEITAVSVDPNNNAILYATAADFNSSGSNSDTVSGFYRSTNSGSSWTKITSGLGNAATFRSIAMQDDGTATNVYIGGKNKLTGRGEIYKSNDQGQTWSLYYTGLKNETFNSLLFDGLVSGNTRGLYNVRGKASFNFKTDKSTVKKNTRVTASVILKDAATGKKLRGKTVKFYKKTGTKWVLYKTVKTSPKGVAKAVVKVDKTMRVKAVWRANSKDKHEFVAESTSPIKKITVKK